ncbi:MAG: LytR family transcriptional regulator [Ruminococcaceae bacterium]|nr:LytR family transcriptional regulator [Oscillospiraceae bacterium]
MAKYSNKKRISPILLVLLSIVLLFVLLIGIIFAFVWSKLDKITYADEIEDSYLATDPFDQDLDSNELNNPETASDEDLLIVIEGLDTQLEPPTVPDTEVQTDQNVLNILLIGTDERTTKYSKNARADSMILVSINKDLHTVRLVSLERGIGVPILEGELEGQYDLLTHIFRWGGADLLIKTVEHCFKVDVNHYVRVNFAAVEKIVDTIGGINIEMTAKEAEGINLWTPEGKPKVQAGLNRVNGETALSFARLRWIDSDWQRVGRQRKVILAVVDELKHSDLKELNNLADTVLPLIQTNLTKMEIAELMLYAPNFLRSQFDQMTIPKQGTYGGMGIRNGGGAFAVDYEINNDLLYRFLYEGATSEELLAE